MEKLLLLDGNAMLFRAYYATIYGKKMSTAAGIPTNAVFGFANMLSKAIDTLKIDKIVVAFDKDSHSFRKDIYSEYKGTRTPPPDDLVAQFLIVREYIEALGITQYEQSGLEADDIIGSLAKQTKDYQVFILTGDRDLLQLVDDNTTVYMMKNGITELEKMDAVNVKEKYNLLPYQIVDWKGLAGDKSDNIPGVFKIGDLSATKLLNEYGTVEGVYENIDKISGKQHDYLLQDKEKAFLSKQLATIKTDAVIPVDLNCCVFDYHSQKLKAFYVKYEMKSFLKNFNDFEIVEENQEKIDVSRLGKIDEHTFDDVVCLYIHENDLGIATTTNAYYVEFNEIIKNKYFINYLESDRSKILYDIKQWYHLLDNYHISLNGENVDIKVMAFLNDTKIKEFEDIINKYHFVSNKKKENDQLDLFSNSIDENVALYAYQLVKLKERLVSDLTSKDMYDLYQNIEYPLIKVLYDMEVEGFLIDEEKLNKIAIETNVKVEQLQKEIYQLANKEFNINSPKQLGEVIYDDLKLMKSTKRSTDASVLKKLEDKHPIINTLLEYRKYQKFYSTYANGLKKYIDNDHKIHTIFNQCVAETGRLSSSEPNLQNISVRNPETMIIREAFIPEENCTLVAADYSQVELRILAHMANQENMIEAFKQGIDAHTKTAMDIFNVSEQEVSSTMRRQAKAINFGIDYGMSDYGLAEQLNIPIYQAHDFIEKYFLKYPNIKKFMDDTIQFCQDNGYVVSIMKRRRYIEEINSSNRSLKQFGQRAAMNAPVQASAADLIKIAMINVHNRLEKEGLKSRLILQIHDELILNVHNDEKEKVMRLVSEEMENALKLSVVLKAEATCGNNWLEVK